MTKRILIITYYWPPSGGAGVQRWLKFSKYLPSFGWQPVIYTPENPEIPVIDLSLAADIPKEAEIVKTKIWEPYEWYKRFTGRKGEKINTGFLNEKGKGGFAERIAVWLRGNLFIPDARKYWIKPSVKFLNDYLDKHPVDAIVSSGPPHSMHLIALALKKKRNIKWIADFRDPWTNIDYYKDLMLSDAADKLHHKMEKEVLTNADEVIAVGATMAKELELIAGRKINVITNGFDESDVSLDNIKLDKEFTIAHIGTLVKSRNPEILWKVISSLMLENKNFAYALKIVLVGKVDFHVKEALERNNLMKMVKLVEYIPHDEVIRLQHQSQVLLLVLNDTPNAKGILTGKMFEYLAAGRPVLCIGDTDGDAADIIKHTNSGVTCGFQEEIAMRKAILHYFDLYMNQQLFVNSSGTERYTRRALTSDLVSLLKN
jgi:glycosyltransferase involved in cell wall biosynthesis